ncbi:hypothetical protein PP713_04895 [Mycobacterium sp. CSUR Q5927]|nr:hypothetical protein [Mycobacterium sp. CSUR Q5927]
MREPLGFGRWRHVDILGQLTPAQHRGEQPHLPAPVGDAVLAGQRAQHDGVVDESGQLADRQQPRQPAEDAR